LEGNVADWGCVNHVEPYHAVAEALYPRILRRLLLLVNCMMFVLLMPGVQGLVRHRVGVAAQGTGIGSGKAQCGTFQRPAQESDRYQSHEESS